jgi:hypothetical protein
VWDIYISGYWTVPYALARENNWDIEQLCQLAWDYAFPNYHTTDTPAGTVLCPSVTLRRLVRSLQEEE